MLMALTLPNLSYAINVRRFLKHKTGLLAGFDHQVPYVHGSHGL